MGCLSGLDARRCSESTRETSQNSFFVIHPDDRLHKYILSVALLGLLLLAQLALLVQKQCKSVVDAFGPLGRQLR